MSFDIFHVIKSINLILKKKCNCNYHTFYLSSCLRTETAKGHHGLQFKLPLVHLLTTHGETSHYLFNC